MTDERWRRVEDIFHEALERQSADRVTFLRAACGGDEELRLEVESLLANVDAADSRLESGIQNWRCAV